MKVGYHSVLALLSFLLTERVTVATKAQKKLLHIVLMLNTLLISYNNELSIS